MNLVDIFILFIIGLSVLVGFYRGFVSSVLNMGGCLLAFLLAFWLFPRLADAISGNTELTRVIMSFTDSSSLLGDLDLATQSVTQLGQSGIQQVVEKANLPGPLATLLDYNLVNQVLSPLGQTSVSDYLNQTIVSVSVNVLCFVVSFLVCYLAISIIINLLRAVFRFPVLKQLDWLAGGLFGFARGVVFCFVLFTIMPLLVSVIPIENFRTMVDESALAKIFENGNLIISIMNRKL